MNNISDALKMIENKAKWVVASNGKRVLKDDLDVYEVLLKQMNNVDKKMDDESMADYSFDSVEDSIHFIINSEVNNKKYVRPIYNKMRFISKEDIFDPFDIEFDDNYLKVINDEDFDFDKHDKGRKFYINSWLINVNNKTNYSDVYKNIMFKMIQFIAFYKNRDNELNDKFILKIEKMIDQEDLTINERKDLYDKLGCLSKLVEK